jgi:hypothetical protein
MARASHEAQVRRRVSPQDLQHLFRASPSLFPTSTTTPSSTRLGCQAAHCAPSHARRARVAQYGQSCPRSLRLAPLCAPSLASSAQFLSSAARLFAPDAHRTNPPRPRPRRRSAPTPSPAPAARASSGTRRPGAATTPPPGATCGTICAQGCRWGCRGSPTSATTSVGQGSPDWLRDGACWIGFLLVSCTWAALVLSSESSLDI